MADEFDDREQRILRRYQAAPSSPGLSPEDQALLAKVAGREAIANAQTTVNLRDATAGSADEFAKRRRVAARLGLPLNVVESTWSESQQEDAAKKFNATAGPVLRGRFIDPDFAKLAHDDTESLSSIEALFGALKAGAKYVVSAPDAQRGGVAADISRAFKPSGDSRTAAGIAGDVAVAAVKSAVGLPQAAVGLLDIISGGYAGKGAEAIGVRFADAQKFLDTLYSDPQQRANASVKETSGFLNTLGEMLANPSTIATTVGESAAQMLAGAGVGRGIVAIAPKVAPWLAAALGEGFVGAGTSAEQVRAGNEDGLLTAKQTFAALGSGAGTALFGAVGGKVAARLGLDDIDTVLVAKGLTQQSAQAAKTGFVGAIVRAGISEGVFEELPQSVQEQMWQNWGSGRPLSEGVGAAAAQGLLAGLASGGGFQAVAHASERAGIVGRRAQAAESAAAGMDQIAKVAEASKLRQRDPESFKAFTDELVRDDVPNLYVDAQALMQSGIDLQALAQSIPAVADQIEEAAATGGDILIPTADLLAAETDPALKQSLIEHARTAPDAMSRAEAQAFMRDQGDQIKAEIEQEMTRREHDQTWQMQRDEVAKEFQRQLDEAGRFQPEVNKQYATLLGSFYATQAERAGMTAQELAQKYPLRISDKVPQVAGGQALEQGPATLQSVKQLWDAVGIDGAISEQGDRISLSKIVVPKGDRGTGKGTAAMQALIAYADISGKSITLSPSTDFGGSSKARLVKFYKQFGFIENKGKNRAFTVSDAMYRPGPGKVLEQDARAQLTFGTDITQTSSVMSIFDKADLSSVIHESGHFFLEVQSDLAARIDAQINDGATVSDGERQILSDMNTTLDWFGVKGSETTSPLDEWLGMSLDEKRAMHEQFARGWEAYAFEGKSPSVELRGVFQRFSAWLKQVYRAIKNLDVTLTDEVRSVFDRMIATEDQIREAEHLRGLTSQLEREASEIATQKAIDALQSKALGDMKWLNGAKSKKLRDMQKKVDGLRAEVRREVTAEVMSRPVYQAWQFLTGKIDPNLHGDPVSGRLSTEALKDIYGTDEGSLWKKLSDRRMTSPNGMNPDIAAETLGYPSGDAMVRALIEARDPKVLIEELTDQRMLEKHGDLGTQEGLERATNEALANDLRTGVLSEELANIERQAQTDKMQRGRIQANAIDQAAREYARELIGRMAVKDLRPSRFEAAATRAAKASAKALRVGDFKTAAVQKRSELIQMHAAKAVYDALEDVNGFYDFARTINNRSLDKIGKTRDVDVVQAIRAILAEYGIGSKGEKAQQYLEAVERNDPDMHKVLKDRMDAMMANAGPVESLSLNDLRTLNEEIGGLWHLALRSHQMEVDGNLIDRQEVQDQLLSRLKDIGIPESVPGEGKAVTDKERRIARIREGLAALKRVENWAVAKDGQDNGVFTRYVFRPIKDAADAYRADKAKALKQYRELLKGVDLGKSRISAPELDYEFGYSKGGSGKAELLHAILHTGNESNKRKLLLGRGWATELDDGSIDTGRWDRFVDRMIREGTLTTKDFDFAQGVWDLLESLKPLAQKTHRDVFGRYFDEITANPVTNSLGTWKGGYVPAMTDAEVVKDAKTRDLAEAENSTMAFAFPATSKGFTKSRVEYNKPLLLDLRSLAQHIDKVLLFSHMEQHVRDVRRVLASGDVAEPLHRVDPAAFGSLITPWLNRAARQQVETPIPGDGGVMRVLSKLRARAGMAAMFANVANTAQQVTGLSIAAVKVNPRHLLSAASRYVTSPRKTAQSVAEASQYMASRMDNEVAQMSQEIEQILLNPSLYEKAQNWSARHAYFMQSAVDNVIGPIVWTGAYNQALEQGMSEDDARKHGDAVVRQTQGSTLPEDISRIESGNAWWRMFAQFAGYFNMQANLLGTEFANQMRDLGLRRGMGKGLYIFTLGFLVPALVSELIVQAFRGGPGDDDKDGEYLDDWFAALGMGTIRSGIAMVPVAGQVANYGINLANTKPYDDRISTAPAISMIESAVRAPQSIYAATMDDGNKQKAVRDLATLISITTGLPANAIARPVGYLAGVEDDKINPTGPADAARGLITGVASPESK